MYDAVDLYPIAYARAERKVRMNFLIMIHFLLGSIEVFLGVLLWPARKERP